MSDDIVVAVWPSYHYTRGSYQIGRRFIDLTFSDRMTSDEVEQMAEEAVRQWKQKHGGHNE